MMNIYVFVYVMLSKPTNNLQKYTKIILKIYTYVHSAIQKHRYIPNSKLFATLQLHTWQPARNYVNSCNVLFGWLTERWLAQLLLGHMVAASNLAHETK